MTRLIVRSIQVAVHVPDDLSEEMANAHASDAISESMRHICSEENSAILDWEYLEEFGQKQVNVPYAVAYDIFEDYREEITKAKIHPLFP